MSTDALLFRINVAFIVFPLSPAYLLEPGSSSGYDLRDIVSRYLGVSLDLQKGEPQAGEQHHQQADAIEGNCEVNAQRLYPFAVKAQVGRCGIIPELENPIEPTLSHDSSTNNLIRRYREIRRTA